MNFWKTLLSFKRAELHFVLFAAFFALCVLPSGTPGAVLAPQSASAVLFLISGESFLSETKSQAAPPALFPREKTPATPSARRFEAQKATHRVLETPVAALISGVRTNRRLI